MRTKYPDHPQQDDVLEGTLFETAEKVALPLFRVELHPSFNSISCEIVLGNLCEKCHFRGTYPPKNDGFHIYSIVCGRWNSLQEHFFDKLSKRHESLAFVFYGFHKLQMQIYVSQMIDWKYVSVGSK